MFLIRSIQKRLFICHKRMDIRNKSASSLLCCTLCNRLPAFSLCFFLFAIKLDYTALHLYWNNLMHAKFHTLLNNCLHLIGLWQSLKQYYSWRQLTCSFTDLLDFCCHFFCIKLCNAAKIFMTAIVNTNLFTNLHSKHIFDVIYITSNDCYLVCSCLLWVYKKMIQIFTSH